MSNFSHSMGLFMLRGLGLTEKQYIFLDELMLCGLEQKFLVFKAIIFNNKEASLVNDNTINLFIMATVAKKEEG